jgi:hypothetical protein
MANISGARGTGNITAAQIYDDKDNKLYLLDANKAPLTALTAKTRKRPTKNPKFSWFEDVYGQYIDAINYSTGYADSDTSMAVDNASYFTVNDVVKNARTAEVMRVTAVGTSDVAFERGVGETSAAAVNDDDPLWIIGSAAMEGDDSEEMNSTNAAEVYNYCQIFRTPFEVTDTENNTDLWTGRDLETQKGKKAIEHAQKIERAFFFGERAIDTNGAHPRRYTRGLQKFITTNVTDAGGTLTEAEFETFLRGTFRYGSRTKYLFASRLTVSAISSWAQGKLQMFPSDKAYGIAITRYISPHGEVRIIPHDMLEGTAGLQTGYSGWNFLIDMDNVMYRPQQGLDTRMKMNIQAPDEELIKGEYRTHVGLQLIQEKTHGILYDVTQY